MYARKLATLEEHWMRHALTGRLDGRRRWAGAAAVAMLLGALWALAWGTHDAGAGDSACNPTCVILIQVDGLEPKDITQATTPYMWALAHPPTPGVPGSALNNRAGWIWQAPRGVAATGTAPASASLLTGAFPEKTGITGDDLYRSVSDTEPFARQRLSSGGFGDSPPRGADDPTVAPDVAAPVIAPDVETLVDVASKSHDTAAFLGDPGLAEIAAAKPPGQKKSPTWFPPGDNATATYPESQYTGDPRLCPVPRYPDRGYAGVSQPQNDTGYNPSHCPANDLTTVHKAISDLQQQDAKRVAFTFIHLAEYGAAKRLAGDPKVEARTDPNTAPPQPAQALADADAAVSTFVERYGNGAPAGPSGDSTKWARTVLMIVGSHGYQITPASNRVPDPGNAAATSPTDQPPVTIADHTRDLSDWVWNYNRHSVVKNSLRLVPQGTMATIYYTDLDHPENRAKALKAIKDELERRVPAGGESATTSDYPNAACKLRNPAPAPALPDCIDKVYYVDGTLAAQHPTWHLETHSSKAPYARTRNGGDLIVLFGRGWASGRIGGSPYQVVAGKAVTNPYTASAGGPQERAVAALINGPSGDVPGGVRNLDTFARSQPGLNQLKYYPVSKTKVDPSDNDHPPPVPAVADQACPETTTDPGGLGCANDPTVVADDAGHVGHEAQPVTVDFAITISALMRLPFERYPDQLQGRVLQEAFVKKLTPPCVSDCEPPPPPQCNDVAALTTGTQPVSVNMSCADAAGAPLTYTIVSGPPHGTLGAVQSDTVGYTAASGFSGNDTFTYRATSKNGTSEVATATVIVMEPPVVVRQNGFDFYGLVRGLKALVVDSNDHPYARAPRGAILSTIHLEGDFGKPETAVTLTFYQRVASASARSARVVRLKAIARFDPFVVKRGHVTMRLKVPPLFKPSYVGVTVREIATSGSRRRRVGGVACSSLKTLKRVPFRCTGPSSGAILPIADAVHLHKPKVGGPAPRRRR
jgi:hypothetical protein